MMNTIEHWAKFSIWHSAFGINLIEFSGFIENLVFYSMRIANIFDYSLFSLWRWVFVRHLQIVVDFHLQNINRKTLTENSFATKKNEKRTYEWNKLEHRKNWNSIKVFVAAVVSHCVWEMNSEHIEQFILKVRNFVLESLLNTKIILFFKMRCR